LSNHCGTPAELVSDEKVSKKNVIVSLIVALANVLTLALFRASPGGAGDDRLCLCNERYDHANHYLAADF